MGKKKNLNFRGRKFCILLYPDNQEHLDALEYIKMHYNYCFILHDGDTNDNGELKKPHYHVVLDFNNAKWNTALASEINLSTQFIQKCNNFEHALEYLIHYNDDSKHQYDISKVHGPLTQKLKNFIIKNDNTEDERICYILDYIFNYNGPISIKNLSIYCQHLSLWGDYRRNASIIFKLVDEHNQAFYEKEKNYERKREENNKKNN